MFLQKFLINTPVDELNGVCLEGVKSDINTYIDFCYDNNIKKKSNYDYLTHNHHILPKSMGGVNKSENYTRLTIDDHISAHKMLINITNGQDRLKMRAALQYLLNMMGKGGSYGFKKSLIINQDFYKKYKPTFVNYSKLKLVKHKVSANTTSVLQDILSNKTASKFDIKIINTLFHLLERNVYNFWIHNETNPNKKKILDTFDLLESKGYITIIRSGRNCPKIYSLDDKFISMGVDFVITENILDLPAWASRYVNYKKTPAWQTIHDNLAKEMGDLIILIYKEHYMFAAKDLHKLEELDMKYEGILYKRMSKSCTDKMLRDKYPTIIKQKLSMKL